MDFWDHYSSWTLPSIPAAWSEDTRVELRGQRQEARFRREQTGKRFTPVVTLVPRPVAMQARITQHRG